MTELTVEQLTDFRADIGDQGTPPAFTDDELQRLYVRTEGSYDRSVVKALEQLLINAVKFTDYTAGQTSEKKSQIFEHLKYLFRHWEEKAAVSQQVSVAGMRIVPPKAKDRPYGFENESDKKLRHTDPLNRRRRY